MGVGSRSVLSIAAEQTKEQNVNNRRHFKLSCFVSLVGCDSSENRKIMHIHYEDYGILKTYPRVGKE